MSGRLVLVRHGQSCGNVDKRLDTRPPGAELTPLGREQARDFAKALPAPPTLLLHSVATRAVQTAEEISGVVGVPAREVTGIHEVQAGDLENRNDDAAIDEFHADLPNAGSRASTRCRCPAVKAPTRCWVAICR